MWTHYISSTRHELRLKHNFSVLVQIVSALSCPNTVSWQLDRMHGLNENTATHRPYILAAWRTRRSPQNRHRSWMDHKRRTVAVAVPAKLSISKKAQCPHPSAVYMRYNGCLTRPTGSRYRAAPNHEASTAASASRMPNSTQIQLKRLAFGPHA